MTTLPRLLITMGDVAGVGPEIIARGWPQLLDLCRPVVVGDSGWLERTLIGAQSPARVQVVRETGEVNALAQVVPCMPGSDQDLRHVLTGCVTAAAGRAAYDFLCMAIDLTMRRQADGIVTAPLHKEGLRAAGLHYPGHTEILAERTGTRQFGMMLYADGLGVVHVTLHMGLREVFRHLTAEAILEKIRLLDGVMSELTGRRPRIGVAALNPHASDGGLFGDDEEKIIGPAVARGQAEGLNASGPWPCDTLFVRARRGEFDGVVAMYHDQGHIAMKLLAGWRAVNIS
ncbi:MAG TPA: 4-hydroxythreonine-4-phosphate dehydrogenase PdxA, partial [Gemmataceae bacterium]|nr:4-hydroxythreonine-4-phosphate dehydrogenase PdxA [Gemmataceae bacterium]